MTCSRGGGRHLGIQSPADWHRQVKASLLQQRERSAGATAHSIRCSKPNGLQRTCSTACRDSEVASQRSTSSGLMLTEAWVQAEQRKWLVCKLASMSSAVARAPGKRGANAPQQQRLGCWY